LIALGCASGLAVKSHGMVAVDQNGRDTEEADGWKRVVELSAMVPRDLGEPGWCKLWDAFANAIFLLDERVQDALSARTYGELSAYLLGRALAETSWALDPRADSTAFSSWEHLLGEERCVSISDMVERLTCHVVPTDVSQAIRGSLAAWHRKVADDLVRADPSSVARLRQQSDLWRDLLLSGASPSAVVPPKATLMHVSSIRPVARMLLPQLVVGVVSATLLAVATWLFTTHHASGGATGAVIGVFSLLGLTGSAISAKAKSDVNGTLGKLQTALQVDLIVERATILPDDAMPKRGKFHASVPGELAEPVPAVALHDQGVPGSKLTGNGADRPAVGAAPKLEPTLTVVGRHVRIQGPAAHPQAS
jgi:hypothetical protein